MYSEVLAKSRVSHSGSKLEEIRKYRKNEGAFYDDTRTNC